MKKFSVLLAFSFCYANPKYAAFVLNAQNGQVYFNQYADSPRHPASLTKMMTLYILFEALNQKKISLNHSFVISERACAQIPSKIGLQPYKRISVAHSILALTVKSANDVAVAVAEGLSGSVEQFAARMNQKAKQLGMHKTHFVNPSGVPDKRQITTARDMAVLGWALQRHFPQYYHYFAKRGFYYNQKFYRTHNHMLNTFHGMDGIKTGYINDSGFNLVGSAARNDSLQRKHRLIAVVMGGPSANWRNSHMKQLLEMGFSKVHKNTYPIQNVSYVASPTAKARLRRNTARMVSPAAKARVHKAQYKAISMKPLPRPH